MRRRAKWIVAIALLIVVGLWLATLQQLRPLTTSQVLEVRHAA
ncbi:MAG: hypothetical protein AAFR73_02905 [Pseudomonadota bacterium]